LIAALLLLAATDLCAVGVDAGGLAVASTRGLEIEGVAFGEVRPILAIAASPDGRLLAEAGGLAAAHGSLRLWSVESGELLWERQVHRDVIYDVAWSPDGRTLYTASADATVGTFPASGEGGSTVELHSDQVLCLAVAADGTLASGSLDRTIRIWKNGECERVLKSHAGRVTSLAFNPDGTQLASGAADRTVRIWQHKVGRMRRIIRDHDGIVLALLWTDERLLSGCSDGAVRELDPVRAEVSAVVRRHDDWVQALAMVGGKLVSGDASGELRWQ